LPQEAKSIENPLLLLTFVRFVLQSDHGN
jgi:hypothetical protein